MAFSTATATNIAGLVTALDTFLVANGWTQDLLNTGAGKAAWHRSNIFFGVRWDTGAPNHLGVYQALGFTDPPGTAATDSGNGANSSTDATIGAQRCVNGLGNGPFTYWFFEQDFYVHVVVESAADVFRHFGAGTLEKTGDWTGGEYAYGHRKDTSGAVAIQNCLLLDGLFHSTSDTTKRQAATLHVEGLPNQGGTGKWGQVWGSTTTPPNDTAAIAKVVIQGGFRAGPTATSFGTYPDGSGSGGISMYPIEVYYHDVANFRVYYLGRMKDVRGINVRNFSPRQVVSIGGSDWYIFPAQQKTVGSSTTGTQNQGIAYRRDNG